VSAAAGHSHRLESIDVLRGFAALWVVLSHYLPHWNDRLESTLVIVPNPWGVYAVKLFFVISGFVIFMTLDRCRSVTQFAVLRFSRLYPAYWASMLLVTLASVLLFHGTFWPGGFVTNATMFQEFLGFPHLDTVYWSLSVELAFYLNAAWLFVLGLHRRPKRIVAVWLLASCLWALVRPGAGADGHRDLVERLLVLDYAPYFAMGIVFFEALKNGWKPSGVALIAFAGVTDFLLGGWKAGIVAAMVALIFLLALRGHLNLLISRVTLWLGAISYSTYLVHRNLGYQTLDWLYAHGLPAALAMPLTIAGALLVAWALTAMVEKPALERIRRLYASLRQSPPLAPAR
jgi:peptidoglycan/LPS O-acetylase OafA/YrhL